jgi:hypothetical protein
MFGMTDLEPWVYGDGLLARVIPIHVSAEVCHFEGAILERT